ncbi:hypothetical protein ABK040_009187 [Willaertia magna]
MVENGNSSNKIKDGNKKKNWRDKVTDLFKKLKGFKIFSFILYIGGIIGFYFIVKVLRSTLQSSSVFNNGQQDKHLILKHDALMKEFGLSKPERKELIPKDNLDNGKSLADNNLQQKRPTLFNMPALNSNENDGIYTTLTKERQITTSPINNNNKNNSSKLRKDFYSKLEREQKKKENPKESNIIERDFEYINGIFGELDNIIDIEEKRRKVINTPNKKKSTTAINNDPYPNQLIKIETRVQDGSNQHDRIVKNNDNYNNTNVNNNINNNNNSVNNSGNWLSVDDFIGSPSLSNNDPLIMTGMEGNETIIPGTSSLNNTPTTKRKATVTNRKKNNLTNTTGSTSTSAGVKVFGKRKK